MNETGFNLIRGRRQGLSCHRTRRAFTLIELLVVIAVIAMLLSILTPSLRKAKNLARRITCNTNVKQQHLSFMLYASDNDGKFPRHDRAHPYYVRGRTDGQTIFDAFYGTYIENSEILLCPLLKNVASVYSTLELPDVTNGWGGWETTDPDGNPVQNVMIGYSWFANYVPYGGEITYFNAERPWATRAEECGSTTTFITHNLFEFNSRLYDHSHGGQAGAIEDMRFEDSKATDNPIGHGDGSITTQKKSQIDLRAEYTPWGGLLSRVYY